MCSLKIHVLVTQTWLHSSKMYSFVLSQNIPSCINTTCTTRQHSIGLSHSHNTIITQTKPSLGFLMGSANGTDHIHLWVAERIENLDLERCSFLWKVFERQHFVWIVLVRQSHLTFYLARCWTFTNGSMGYRTRRPNFYQA